MPRRGAWACGTDVVSTRQECRQRVGRHPGGQSVTIRAWTNSHCSPQGPLPAALELIAAG